VRTKKHGVERTAVHSKRASQRSKDRITGDEAADAQDAQEEGAPMAKVAHQKEVNGQGSTSIGKQRLRLHVNVQLTRRFGLQNRRQITVPAETIARTHLILLFYTAQIVLNHSEQAGPEGAKRLRGF
jgi:hypothetical protein